MLFVHLLTGHMLQENFFGQVQIIWVLARSRVFAFKSIMKLFHSYRVSKIFNYHLVINGNVLASLDTSSKKRLSESELMLISYIFLDYHFFRFHFILVSVSHLV